MNKNLFVLGVIIYTDDNSSSFEGDNLDILTICETIDDCYTYINRQLVLNKKIYDKDFGEGVIKYTISKPHFFKGRCVLIRWTNTKENKTWIWEYSILEKNLYNPNDDKLKKRINITHEELTEI